MEVSSSKEDIFKDQLVSISNHSDLSFDVKPIAHEFPRLGKLLQLSEAKMEELEYHFTDHPDYGISEVVREWCRWNCDRTRYGSPTLRWFLNAVKEIDPKFSMTLEQKFLDKIEKEKIRTRKIVPLGQLDYSLLDKTPEQIAKRTAIEERLELERRLEDEKRREEEKEAIARIDKRRRERLERLEREKQERERKAKEKREKK